MHTHADTRRKPARARFVATKRARIHLRLVSVYCFANISATEAQIFMKFEIYLHKVVKNHQIICRKDPCKDARTRGVSVCARVSSRQNAHAHVYVSCPRVCARIFTKNYLMILYNLMKISLKFHKDRSFRCGDICKTILTFKNQQFLLYFAYFHIFAPPKSSQMDNY